MNDTTNDYYGTKQMERRDRFNKIINGIDAVLMNNISEIDPSVYENWQGKSPISEQCDIEDNDKDEKMPYYCNTHDVATNEAFECEEYEGETEVYQWFAINQNDAEFLQEHNQYITYSDMLDTYFWAITHFGTGWDYVDSMVDDILGDK
jgi:hypothetical protein